MTRRTLCVAVAVLVVALGCSPTAPPPGTPGAQARPSAAKAKPGAFPRQQLLEDTRELARIIEETHPDPYSSGGGRIAFHRRLHQALNALPDEGMTKEEYQRLVRPFVAGVGDAHTNFTRGYSIDRARPGGVPLRLKVVEESLVVVGIERPNQALLGSRLVSVEGIALADLTELLERALLADLRTTIPSLVRISQVTLPPRCTGPGTGSTRTATSCPCPPPPPSP
jgi:hypothetical protein